MGDRINKNDVEQIVVNLNARMENIGSSVRYRVSYRYDYCALDRIVFGVRRSDAVAAGTKREVYQAAWYMINALNDSANREN